MLSMSCSRSALRICTITPDRSSFPGGRQDEEDADIVATALRESAEEIGTDSTRIEVVGTLPNYVTVTAYEVTPVVAASAPQHYRVDPFRWPTCSRCHWLTCSTRPTGAATASCAKASAANIGRSHGVSATSGAPLPVCCGPSAKCCCTSHRMTEPDGASAAQQTPYQLFGGDAKRARWSMRSTTIWV